MFPDRDRSGWGCLALSCTTDGVVVEIVRDDVGFTRAAGPGARLPDIVDGDSKRKAENLIAALREHECIVGWQLNVPAADGTVLPLWFAAAVTGDSLVLLAAPGPESDHRIYEELSRLNNELVNRERELARKTAALERLSAEKNRLVAIAAHDLRNPLTVIGSYADLLRIEGAVTGEHLSYVEEISRSARFMTELVEEMLDSSRLESGHADLDLQDIDLVGAARHAATINRVRAERKQITISFDPAVERAVIRADAVKLRQIINNLVVNAIKFSPSRSNVTIRVRRTATHALLEVEDQGIGIPLEKLETIFEPFATLGSSGTAGEKSTGLGLAIVKQLAALHRATVEVESEEGRGSLFRVSFPHEPLPGG